ncbi:MAG: prepilin peptidase [Deltaproteobacteria bacterium]|nr:prepilin peptidase [Deltaproteobacteria bacterium]
MPEALKYAFIFAFGAAVGSFLNVCIHRIPRGISVVSPGSRCPACGSSIRFYDNIPIISYVFLLGRCRNCNAPISAEYPLVELLVAAAGVFLYGWFGLTAAFALNFILVSALVAITFIDLRHRIIPNVISLPGIAAGFIMSVIASYPDVYSGAASSLLGLSAGGVVLIAISAAYYFVARQAGMGGGDVKLLAMIGAFLGWKGVLFTLFAGSFAGAAVGAALMLVWGKKSKYAIPFGPFLAFGAVTYIFYGKKLFWWYITSVWQV